MKYRKRNTLELTQLCFKSTVEVKEMIRKAAKLRDVNMSVYVESVLLKQLKKDLTKWKSRI